MIRSLFVSTFCFALVATSNAYAAKSFVYCSEGSPATLNPQLTADGAAFNVTNQIYDGLVKFKYGTTEVEPGLATSWKVSNKGKTYTFKLRKGVKFHGNKRFKPTRDFNADDVLFTFNRQRLPNHPYHKVSGGRYEYFQGMGMQKLVKDIKKLDDYTVQFVLTRPEAPFIANLAMDFAIILSKEYGDAMLKAKSPEVIDNYPLGTGPFRFVRYDKDQTVRFKKFKQHWGEKAKIDNLIFSITTDASVRFQKLKAGECHLISEPAPSDLAAMKKNKKLRVQSLPGLNVGYIAFNVEKKPFDNRDVRKAIHLALNRDSYIDAIYLGNATVAVNPIPPTMWSYHKKNKKLQYNVNKAKALLKKAGFPNGFETELWTLPVSRPYNPNGKKMGEMIQADLAKIGIKVKLVSYDWPTYLAKTKTGDHAMAQFGWNGDNGDPDNFLHTLLGCDAVAAGGNRSRWCYKPFDKLVNQAKTVSSQKKRARLYVKAQEIFKKELPWVTLAHSTNFRAMQKGVQNYKMSPFYLDDFSKVDLK